LAACLLGPLLLPSLLAAADVRLQRLDVSKLPEIECYFTVVTEKGDSILGLLGADFSVQVDGVPQKVEHLSSAMDHGHYLAVALLVDGSGSMKPHLGQARKAAAAFIERTGRDDRVAIFSCAESLLLHQDFSTDRSLAREALAGVKAGRNTAIFDAIKEVLALFKNVPARRQALMVLSDGHDNRSRSTIAEIIQLARDAGVPLFTIGLGPGSDDRSLRRLSAETGGEFYKAVQAGELLDLYRRIGERLSNQYLLGFVLTPAGDGRWHDLRISYSAPSGAPCSVQRQFLAATSPTMVPSAVASMQSRLKRRQQYWQLLPGALLGLLAGTLLLAVLKLRRPAAPFFSWLGLAVVGVLTLLGAVIAVLIPFFSS
jgi:VWFA-related protein